MIIYSVVDYFYIFLLVVMMEGEVRGDLDLVGKKIVFYIKNIVVVLKRYFIVNMLKVEIGFYVWESIVRVDYF